MSKRLKRLFVVMTVLCIALAIGACARKRVTPQVPPAKPDANVTLDGALQEEFWDSQKWLTATSTANVTIKSTAAFGKNGLYFGVNVNDASEYAADKELLQVFFASESYATVADGLYRIGITAGGTATLTRYTDTDSFESVTLDATKAPQTVTLRQSDGKSYNAEIFVPYELFDGIIDGVWFNTAIAVSDGWQNLAATEIGGVALTPNTWWKMNAKGLFAYDITIQAGAHGRITAKRNYLQPNEKVTFTIEADDGYYISALTMNGANVYGQIKNQNGVVTYTSPAMNNVIVLNATFAETVAVSGTIKYNEAVNPTMNADLDVMLTNGTISASGSINAVDGKYTVALLQGTYKLVFTSKSENYTVYTEEITLSEDLLDHDINVGQYSWGEKRIAYIDDSMVALKWAEGGEKTIYEGKLATATFAFSAFFSVNHGSYTDRENNVTGVYFYFDDSSKYLNIQVLNWNHGGLVLKDVKNNSGDAKPSDDVKSLEKRNGGIYVTVFVHDDVVSFWVDNGNGVFGKIKEYSVDGLSDARLTKVTQYGADGIEDSNPFYLTDARIACNATTMGDIYPEIKMQADCDSSKVEVSGLGTYKYGDAVAFTVSAKTQGDSLRVVYNGTALEPNGAGYSFTASAMNEIKIFAYSASDKASVTLALESDFDFQNVRLKLRKDTATDITETVGAHNTVTLSNVGYGTYDAYLTVGGLDVSLGQLDVYDATISKALRVSNIYSDSEATVTPVEGNVSSNGTTSDKALYTIDGLCVQDTLYLQFTLKLDETENTNDNGPGFVIRVGDAGMNIRFNNAKKIINVWYDGKWSGIYLPDWSDLHEDNGVKIIIELNPKTGVFAFYISDGNTGACKLYSDKELQLANVNNVTITRIAVNSWQSDKFSITGLVGATTKPTSLENWTILSSYDMSSDGATTDKTERVVDNLSISDTLYLQFTLKMDANTKQDVDDPGCGVAIEVGGKELGIKFNNKKEFINVWYNSVWHEVYLPDFSALHAVNGVTVIIALNPQNGALAFYMPLGNAQYGKLSANKVLKLDITNAMIAKIAVKSWKSDPFSIAGLKSISKPTSLDNATLLCQQNITGSVTSKEVDLHKIAGLSETDTVYLRSTVNFTTANAAPGGSGSQDNGCGFQFTVDSGNVNVRFRNNNGGIDSWNPWGNAYTVTDWSSIIGETKSGITTIIAFTPSNGKLIVYVVNGNSCQKVIEKTMEKTGTLTTITVRNLMSQSAFTVTGLAFLENLDAYNVA